MSRSLLLVALLAGYAAVGLDLFKRPAASFDPLGARGRHVEMAIETGRYDEALPAALELQREYEHEPAIAYWLAEIYRGLNRSSQEAEAWESYVRLGGAPEDACPGLPEAYAKAGDQERSLAQLHECVRVAPDNPERLIDLADGQANSSDVSDALTTYEKAEAQDPHDPRIVRRIEHLSTGSGGS